MSHIKQQEYEMTRVDDITPYTIDAITKPTVFYFAKTAPGALVVNLPSVVGITGKWFSISNFSISVDKVTLTPAGGETINGLASYDLLPGERITIIAVEVASFWIFAESNMANQIIAQDAGGYYATDDLESVTQEAGLKAANLDANKVGVSGSPSFNDRPDYMFELLFGTVNTDNVVVDNCDVLNMSNEDDANVFEGFLDASFRKGTGSTLISSKTTDPAGVHRIWQTFASVNWAGSNRIGFWCKSAVPRNVGDVQLYVLDTVAGAQYINLPALLGDSKWHWIEIDISGIVVTSVDALGFRRNINVIFDIYVDNITRFATANSTLLTNMPVNVDDIVDVAWMTGVGAGMLVEDTDYLLGVDANRLIPITDQTGTILLCSYWHQ